MSISSPSSRLALLGILTEYLKKITEKKYYKKNVLRKIEKAFLFVVQIIENENVNY